MLKRLDWIDYAKGIGIVFVVFGHVLKGLIPLKLINSTFYYYSINFIYSFHMPLFFLLSGYFFKSSLIKREFSDFFITKIQTILYPFIIWSLLQTLIEIMMTNYTNNHIAGEVIFTCLIQPRSQFWFLFALFFINLICGLIYKISKNRSLIILVFVWVLFINSGLDIKPFDKTLTNLIYFSLGIFMSRYSLFTEYVLKNKYVFLGNFIIFFYSLSLFYYQHPLDKWYNQVLPQFSGSFIILFISKQISNINIFKFFQYLGQNSMVIYLVHLLAGNGIRIFLFKILHIENSYLHILFGTLFGIFAPIFVYKMVLKTKGFSWLFVLPKMKTRF